MTKEAFGVNIDKSSRKRQKVLKNFQKKLKIVLTNRKVCVKLFKLSRRGTEKIGL